VFQLIERQYVGPNQLHDRYADADLIEIRRMDFSSDYEANCCPVIHDGDWSISAYGAYKNLLDALHAIKGIFGEVRNLDLYKTPFKSPDPNALIVFKPGQYAPLGCEASYIMAANVIGRDVSASHRRRNYTACQNLPS
jgi:hypothetical protein